MSVNLIEMAKSLFANEVAGRAATAFGESESGVNNAISALVPTIFSGLAQKASTQDGAETVARLAQENAQGGLFDNLGSLLGGADNSSWFGRGSSLVSNIFGNKVDNIVNLISNFAGIKSSSSSSLLSLAVPAILGFLGKYMRTNNVNAGGLSSLLGDQRSYINSALPGGFSLANLFGGDTHRDHTTTTTTTTATTNRNTASATPHNTHTNTYVEEENRGGIGKWLLPLLLLGLLAAGLLYYFNGGCNRTAAVHDDTTVVDTTTTVAPMDVDTATTVVTPSVNTNRTLSEVRLGNGTVLQAYPGGVEDQLVQFIGSDEYKNSNDEALKNKWFNFDDLNFEFGTTKLTPESQRQLQNIVQILKANPDVKIKIGAYTDKKGDDKANLKLSDDRAKAVQSALKAAGVGSQVPQAEGYGEQFATVDENASDDARLVDRKTSIRLLKS